MGKQPTTGQKKSKDQIAKAATQKKGAHKKWTKGKAKEKVQNAVFIDKATHERILTGIPKIGKHISVSQVVQKYKVGGSIARAILKELSATDSLKTTQKHSKQALFYPGVVAAEKTVVVTADKEAPKKQKGAKPEKKEKK